jgi:hypothetical protein
MQRHLETILGLTEMLTPTAKTKMMMPELPCPALAILEC